MVSELIDEEKREWCLDAIHGKIGDKEAKRILTIPLWEESTVDVLYWPKEKDGQYTVRSGYKELRAGFCFPIDLLPHPHTMLILGCVKSYVNSRFLLELSTSFGGSERPSR